jgi:hypothetical protein
MMKVNLLRVTYRRVGELQAYAHVLVRSEMPAAKFVIFAQGRTGSELLRSLINCNPLIDCQDEILDRRVFFPKTFLEGRCASSKKQVYGFKVKIYQLTRYQRIQDPGGFVSDLHQGGWKIIHLWRRNLLRHTISGLVARQRKIYHHKKSDGPQELGKIPVDCERLLSKMKERGAYLLQERQILGALPHLPIVYEDDLLPAQNHQGALDRVFDFLRVPSVPVETQHARVTPSRLSSFIENYEELVRVVGASEYREFLET